MSSIESAFWPDMALYLIDCREQRSRRMNRSHLDPRHDDRFPLQGAAGEMIDAPIARNRNFFPAPRDAGGTKKL